MATKTTGTELKRFYADPEFWPDGIWHEDEEISIDGEDPPEDFEIEKIPDDAVCLVANGVVMGPPLEGKEPSFETYFKRWRKKQTTTTLVVECEILKLDVIKAAIKSAGGHVL